MSLNDLAVLAKATAYNRRLFALEDETVQRMNAAAQARGLPTYHIRPEEARVLQFLALAVKARKIVEVGALYGYSGLFLARALPADGVLHTVEKEPRHAQAAREFLAQAGLGARAQVHQGEGLATLTTLAAEGPFDFMFLDADRPHYPLYLDWALANLRPGGIFTAHNPLRRGEVADEAYQDEKTLIMRRFNERLASEPRFFPVLLPFGSGIAAALVL